MLGRLFIRLVVTLVICVRTAEFIMKRFYHTSLYASAVLGVVILSACLCVRLMHACFVTKAKQRTADVLIAYERAITLAF